MHAHDIGECIAARFAEKAAVISSAFASSSATIRHAAVDEFLPERMFEAAKVGLPSPKQMIRRTGWRERKYVCADPQQFGPVLQALVTGFASDAVAKAVAALQSTPLWPDAQLYNGGVTLMTPGDYMMPHLDNSHDRARRRRRALVVLFYLSDWTPEDGGALTLWDAQVRRPIAEIAYRPNRLVIMEETGRSWHSVARVTGSRPRASLTTYFYGDASENSRVRLTRYRAPPSAPLKRALFDIDFALRMAAFHAGIDRLVGNLHMRPPTGRENSPAS